MRRFIMGFISLVGIVFSASVLYAQEADVAPDSIAFEALCETGETRVFLVAPDGSNFRQISTQSSVAPYWFDVNSRVGYLAYDSVFWTPFVYDLQEQTSEQYAANIGTQALESDYSWSSTGNYFAYVAYKEENGVPQNLLIIMDDKGMNVNTPTPVQLVGYTWSPDGTQIAYVSEDNRLYVQQLPDEAPQLVPTKATFVLFPTWSPDGDSIAYLDMSATTPAVHVWSLDAEEEITLELGNFTVMNIVWSPDSTRLAVSAIDNETSSPDVFVREIAGEEWVRVTNTPEFEESVSWSPDGTRIVFAAQGLNSSIIIAFADGSGEAPLVSGIFLQSPTWSPLPFEIELTEDDAVLPEQPSSVLCE